MSAANGRPSVGDPVNCPGCGSADSPAVETLLQTVSLQHCSRCGLVFSKPLALLHVALAYPPGYYTHQSTRQVLGRRQLLRSLVLNRFYGYSLSDSLRLPTSLPRPINRLGNRILSLVLMPIKGCWRTIPPAVPGGKVLDVGCGNGLYLARLQTLGWQVFGLEPDAEACAFARQAVGPTVICGTLDDHPWHDETFDVITLWHTLEHMTHPLRALQECYALLQRGGLLMMESPNWASVQRVVFGAHWFHLDPPRHQVHFSPHSLASCLSAAGFSDVRVWTVPSAVGVTGSLEAMFLHHKHMLPKSSVSRKPAWRHNGLLKALVWPGETLLSWVGLAGCLMATARKR